MDKRIKVLAFTPNLWAGGAEKVAVTVAGWLDPDSFDVCLAVLDGSNAFHKVPSHVRYEVLGCRRARYSLQSLARLVRRFQPDIVWCVHPHTAAMAAIARTVMRLDYSLVVGISTNRTDSSRLVDLFTSWVFGRAEAVIVLTEHMRRSLAKSGVDESKLTVIGNPIDLEEITSKSRQTVEHPYFLGKHPPIIVNVSRLTAEKGHTLLLKAFKSVRERRPCRLVLIGDGPLRKMLALKASRLGISEDVAFLGAQENPHKFVSRSDVFVLPSEYEGLPLVALEAMACNTPLIISDYAGSQELVEDGVDGMIGKRESADDFAEKIELILSDRKIASSLAKKAGDKAKAYDVKVVIKEYGRVFREAAEKTLRGGVPK